MPPSTACRSKRRFRGVAAGGAIDAMLPHQNQRIGQQIQRHCQPAPLQTHHELVPLQLGPLLVKNTHASSLPELRQTIGTIINRGAESNPQPNLFPARILRRSCPFKGQPQPRGQLAKPAPQSPCISTPASPAVSRCRRAFSDSSTTNSGCSQSEGGATLRPLHAQCCVKLRIA